MSNRKSNYPNAQQPDLEPGEMGELITHICVAPACRSNWDSAIRKVIFYLYLL